MFPFFFFIFVLCCFLFVILLLLSCCCYPDRYPDFRYPDCYPDHQLVSGSLTRNSAESLNEIEKNFPSDALLLRNIFCKKIAEGLSTISNFLVLSIERSQLRSLVSTLFSILVLFFPFQSQISQSEPMWLVMSEVFLSIPGLGISRKFSTRLKRQYSLSHR